MLYAVISDVHGNFPALQAVLEDAEKAGVDAYLFAGDYFTDFHNTCEVYEALCALPNAVFVSGNREWYLEDPDPALQNREQFAGLYLAERQLGEEGLAWTRNMPRSIQLKTPDGRKTILIEHICEELNGALHAGRGSRKCSSGWLREDFPYRDATREEVHAFARSFLNGSPGCAALRERVAADVVIFGHNHMQYAVEEQEVLYLNPGSAGMPLDHQPGAPYALLRYENGSFSVEERRASYDVERTVEGYRNSPFGREAAVWGEICIWQLRTARDHNRVFFRILGQEQERRQPRTDAEHNAVFRRAYALTREWFAAVGML